MPNVGGGGCGSSSAHPLDKAIIIQMHWAWRGLTSATTLKSRLGDRCYLLGAFVIQLLTEINTGVSGALVGSVSVFLQDNV